MQCREDMMWFFTPLSQCTSSYVPVSSEVLCQARMKWKNGRRLFKFTGGCNSPFLAVMPSVRCMYGLRFASDAPCPGAEDSFARRFLPLAAVSRLGKSCDGTTQACLSVVASP